MRYVARVEELFPKSIDFSASATNTKLFEVIKLNYKKQFKHLPTTAVSFLTFAACSPSRA